MIIMIAKVRTPCFHVLLAFILLLFPMGCVPLAEPTQPVILPQPQVELNRYTHTPSVTPSLEPTLTPTLNLLMTLTPTLSPTATLSPTPTSDPYQNYYINTLAERKYGGGVIQDVGDLNSVGEFTRKLFKYRSEGLDLYGFIDIPLGDGPFPVIVMLHGYVPPDEYATLDYSTRYADALAENGFIVVHPNLRGYAPSADGENQLGIGDTLDILNLISLLRSQAGTSGFLQNANADNLGLWGHSMGGGIVQRVLVVDRNISAALLYASISADETLNLAHFDDDGRGNEKEYFPREALDLISPLNYLDRIDAPVSIQHGEADTVVPVEWSRDLCEKLEDLQLAPECTFYPDQPHTFQNSADTQLINHMVAFFQRYLLPEE
jgi:fermentation-respiration switch protein FrsA (DUF1100 family)